jgi:alkylation response protein AidB-like acyl-CoA dehydrogenase
MIPLWHSPAHRIQLTPTVDATQPIGQDTREAFFSDIREPAASRFGCKQRLGFYQLMGRPQGDRLIIAVLFAGVAESAVLRLSATPRSDKRPPVYQVPAQQI